MTDLTLNSFEPRKSFLEKYSVDYLLDKARKIKNDNNCTYNNALEAMLLQFKIDDRDIFDQQLFIFGEKLNMLIGIEEDINYNLNRIANTLDQLCLVNDLINKMYVPHAKDDSVETPAPENNEEKE